MPTSYERKIPILIVITMILVQKGLDLLEQLYLFEVFLKDQEHAANSISAGLFWIRAYVAFCVVAAYEPQFSLPLAIFFGPFLYFGTLSRHLQTSVILLILTVIFYAASLHYLDRRSLFRPILTAADFTMLALVIALTWYHRHATIRVNDGHSHKFTAYGILTAPLVEITGKFYAFRKHLMDANEANADNADD